MNIPKSRNISKRYQNNKYKCQIDDDDDDHREPNDYLTTIYTMGNKIYFYEDI